MVLPVSAAMSYPDIQSEPYASFARSDVVGIAANETFGRIVPWTGHVGRGAYFEYSGTERINKSGGLTCIVITAGKTLTVAPPTSTSVGLAFRAHAVCQKKSCSKI